MSASVTSFDAVPDCPVMPPIQRKDYLRALVCFRRLVNDKENTRHVFDIVRAVNGDSMVGSFERFHAHETGRLAMADPARLLRAMDDREALRALPEDTLGRAYLAFVEREGLDTNGVQEAAVEAGIDYEMLRRDYPHMYAFAWWQNLSHDLYHVVTGYGRDAIGEGAVLRFTYEHSGSLGARFIARLAGLRGRMEAPRLPAGAIMREASRLGRAANDFVTADWVALLPRPLDEVRRALNVGTPDAYLAVPKDLLASIGSPKAARAEERLQAA